MNEGEPMTLPEAVKRLNFPGDRRALLRVLVAKERASGVRFLIREGGAKRTLHKVTMTAIRRHAADLLPSKVDLLKRDFGAYLKAIDDRIAEGAARHVERYVDPRLAELWERDETIAESVDELGKRVAAIAETATT